MNMLERLLKDVQANPNLIGSVERLMTSIADMLKGVSPDGAGDVGQLLRDNATTIGQAVIANTPFIPGPIPVHPEVALVMDKNGQRTGDGTGNPNPPLLKPAADPGNAGIVGRTAVVAREGDEELRAEIKAAMPHDAPQADADAVMAASGATLDLIGRGYGVKRRPGDEDTQHAA